MRLRPHALLLATTLLLIGPAASAQTPPPEGVLTLDASASMEIALDVIGLSFGTTREGTDPSAVQSALKQALDAALAEARKGARPGELEVQTGNFSLYPRHGEKGQITGWQGSAELIVRGRDLPAISQLSGRITTMSISRVGYSLSREARERVMSELSAQAIARYRARAEELTRQFGYARHVVREVNVSGTEPQSEAVPMMRARAMSEAADQALPLEPGKATVSVTVNGSVQMLR
jgi:predicted secreted protein